ncbi:hypothetical protein RCM87_01145 [Escherichia marmotae]|nr:hypothetical protein [Escherichia coli]MEC9802445.1 hypothetical protein [Escherichia marmotae]MBB7768504.1 hypothetical protein [Escherichia coli]MCN2086277.1 hypothetical protein [Escherichia coli]MED9300343.1 hypothetical protein [Escherichia marmotae]
MKEGVVGGIWTALISCCVLGFPVSSIANDYNTFAIKVLSWGAGYQTNVEIPPILKEGDLITLTMQSNSGSGFISSGQLEWTHGFACKDRGMYIVDVLGFPKSFKPSQDVELVYAEPVGPVTQVVNMYNGLIGLSVAKSTPNKCEQYAEWTKSPRNYYGTGNVVGAKYRVVKLGAPGAFTWSIPVETYFTRRDTDAGWVDMGSLSGVANKDNYTFSGTIRGWCKVQTKQIWLDHKTMTPDMVQNNEVHSKLTIECGGGGFGSAKIALSNHSDKSIVELGNGVKSEVTLSDSEVSIPKDSSVNITVSSKLITSSEEITAGEFTGTEIITVEWL